MIKVQKNIFVIGVDMENRTAEDIARDAALQIVSITDCLVEQQKKAVEEKE